MLIHHVIDEGAITELERYQIARLAESANGLEQRVIAEAEAPGAPGKAAVVHRWTASPPASGYRRSPWTPPIVVSEERFRSATSQRSLSNNVYVRGRISPDGDRYRAVLRDGATTATLPLDPELPQPAELPNRGTVREELGLRQAGTVVALLITEAEEARLAAGLVTQIREACSPQQSGVEFLLLGNNSGADAFYRAASPAAKTGSVRRGDLSLPHSLAAADLLWVPAAGPLATGYVRAAARLGVPAVAVDSAAAREAVEEDVTGLIAPSAAPGESARRIDRLVAAPTQRRELAAAAAAREASRPDAAAPLPGSGVGETVSSRILRFYRELLIEAGLPAPLTASSAAPLGDAASGGTGSARHDAPSSKRPLRIVMVTQEDPFYIPLFFREFFRVAALRRRVATAPEAGAPAAEQPEAGSEGWFPGAARPILVRGVMIQRALGNKTKKGLAKRIYRLYGVLGFVRVGTRYLLAKMAAKVRPERTVAGAARALGVPLLEMSDANGEEFLSFVRNHGVDLVVSVSASQIFKGAILEAPTYGCINLHNAPLPRYRGMLPNFWQMYHGESESVLTIHQMVPDLDKGDILLRKATPIADKMSLEDLIRVTKIRSARALWELLDRFSADTAKTTPLPEEEGSYFSWPSREEAKEFRRRGRKLL